MNCQHTDVQSEILVTTRELVVNHSMWFSYCNCFIVFYCILAYFIMYFTA